MFILIELCFIFIVLLFMVTQVIIPIWTGTQMFPMLSSKAKLQRRIRELEQAAETQRLTDEILRRAESISTHQRGSQKGNRE